MAKEISRRFDLARKVVIVELEDDLGCRSTHTIHLHRDTCPMCGNPYAPDGTAKAADPKQSKVDLALERIHAHLDTASETALDHFEKAGMDVSKYRAKRLR